MILLDTNIISEVMRLAPNQHVVQWLNGQDAGGVFISAVTIGEIEYDLAILDAGARRSALQRHFSTFMRDGFENRILDYDMHAASTYGAIMANRRKLGRPMSAPDGQIAAIARVHALAIATRNVRDFQECGLDLINPFSSSAA